MTCDIAEESLEMNALEKEETAKFVSESMPVTGKTTTPWSIAEVVAP